MAAWAEQERARHLVAAHAVEDERAEAVLASGEFGLDDPDWKGAQEHIWRTIAEWAKSLQNIDTQLFQDEPDKRTIAEYAEELDVWSKAFPSAAMHFLQRQYCELNYGLVKLRVTNDSDQYLPGVELKVHIEFEPAMGFVDVPHSDPPPRVPRPFGQPKPNQLHDPFSSYNVPTLPQAIGGSGGRARDTRIEDGSIKATFEVGELRPDAFRDGDCFYVFLPERPTDGLLHARWTATIKHRDGITRGEFEIPVQVDPIDERSFHSGSRGRGDADS